MRTEGLSSLEDLLLSVRDPESKLLAEEAVAAYYAGAHRSSILSIWVAVCADIIHKLRELATGGDAGASAEITKLQGWISTKDVKNLQGFESSLISIARDKFGILLPHEAEDLDRLKSDRNLCAHPAMVSDDAFFQPTVELARSHIVHACKHLLSKPPIQGKALIARFDRDLLGGAFPSTTDEIEQALRRNYLRRAREGTIVSFTKALSKALFGSESGNYITKEKVIAETLAAVGRIFPGQYESTLRPQFRRLGEELPVDSIAKLLWYIVEEPKVWEWLEAGGQLRLLNKLDTASYSELWNGGLRAIRVVPEIGQRFAARLLREPEDVFIKYGGSAPFPAFIDRVFSLYESSGSFARAEKIGNVLVAKHARFFGPEEIRRLVDCVINNPRSQIVSANGTASILISILSESSGCIEQSRDQWQRLATFIVDGNCSDYSDYPALLAALSKHGITVDPLGSGTDEPAAIEDEDDDIPF